MPSKDENVLYWGSGSPPCWRVMIALAEKGVKYTGKLLTMSNNEHKSAEVLALNPRGQVPTLKLGDIVVNESMAAVDVIEELFPKQGTKLLPDDPKARALVIQRKYEAVNLFDKGIKDTMFYMFSKDPKKEVVEERQEATRKELNIWEGYMKQTGTGAFAAGKSFSQADCAFYPTLAMLCRMGVKLDPRYPGLDDYYKRVTARPSVQATWPPHWKDSPDKDLLKDI